MNSLILKTASRFLIILIIIFSIYSLIRGHNEPGGGFIGGLLLAGAFAIYGLAHGNRAVLDLIPLDLKSIIGIGVLCALASGILGMFLGEPFLTSLWLPWLVPGIGKVGTALLFDIGVYLVVFATVLLVIISLTEE